MVTKTGAPRTEPLNFSAADGGASEAGAAVAGVHVRALRHAFGALEVLAGLDVTAEPGEVVGLVGPSGCGKSTLLEIVAGLREPTAGSVSVAGSAEASKRLARCTYMPQRDLLLPWLAAIDNAALALRTQGASKSAARAAAAPLFERFGLAGFEHARPAELSGGMRQRVAFLRTLAAGKPVLLLDEPFASLDAITRAEMQAWLAEALGEAVHTVLLVSHDVEEALYLSDRVVVLSGRPGQALVELSAPAPRNPHRAATVSTPAFAAVRGRALAALEQGAR
jgi:NitT/TauT family transport system ATP-binding protein